MECLSAERIQGYLDGDLSAGQRAEAEAHFLRCPECRAALEASRRIDEAAAGLPDVEAPADFAAGVMARLEGLPAVEPGRARWLRWIAIPSAGAFVLWTAYLLVAVLSGHGLSQALVKLNALVWGAIRTAAFYAVEGLKTLVMAGKVIGQVAGQAWNALRAATSVVGPEIPAFVIGMMLVVLIAGGFWLRRRNSPAENHHER
jgi:anti-sigma factor RsiW